MLVKAASQSLAEQLAGRFAERNRSRLLAPGTRLPSVRQCAHQQGVSPSTVVAAYDRLLAQGLVEAHRNRGFYIRNQLVAYTDIAHVATNKIVTKEASTRLESPAAMPHVPVDVAALIRGMFHDRSGQPQPGMGRFLQSSWKRISCRPPCAASARARNSNPCHCTTTNLPVTWACARRWPAA